jgi:hypothetical protein
MRVKPNPAHWMDTQTERRPQFRIYSFFNRQLAQVEIAPTLSKQTVVPNCNRQLFPVFFFARISPLQKMETSS